MKILQNINDKTILLNSETNFRTDLGWEDGMQEFEQDTLKSIINPAVNFETVRYIHSGYTSVNNIYESDIWFYFYFVSGSTYGLNYELIGLTSENNSTLLRDENVSFFRLEFYKVPEGELPNSSNRKLVFTKHLPIPLGEKIFYTEINDYIYVPVFTGSNYRNKENMFLYWFQDDSVLSGTLLSGNTFYMTARFYNTIDGTIIPFYNKGIAVNSTVNEETDTYNRVEINRTDYSYVVYSGNTNHRIGTNTLGTPIKFYAGWASNNSILPLPSASPIPTMSVIPTITPTKSPTPSPTPSATPGASTTPSESPSATPSMSISATPSISISATPSASVEPTPSISISSTPSISVTPSNSIVVTPSISISSTPSITPSTSPIVYTTINLARNSDGYLSTCGQHISEPETVITKYTNFNPINTGFTYTLYDEPQCINQWYPAQAQSYGVHWNMGDPNIYVTAYVDNSGLLQNWATCPPPTPTPSITSTLTPTPSITRTPSATPPSFYMYETDKYDPGCGDSIPVNVACPNSLVVSKFYCENGYSYFIIQAAGSYTEVINVSGFGYNSCLSAEANCES